MKQRKYSYISRIFCGLVVLFFALPIAAQGRYFNANNRGVNHYLTIHVGGGEANTFASSGAYDIRTKIGADAQVGLSYEIRRQNFFFNLGGQVQFTYTAQGLDGFADVLTMGPHAMADLQGDRRDFLFYYTDFKETQRTLYVGVPVQFGYYFTPHFYGALGVKLQFPLQHRFSTEPMLETMGRYPQYFEPLTNNPNYRYYTAGAVSSTGTYMTGGTPVFVTPTVELGGRFAVAHRVDLRLGVYAEYSAQIGGKFDRTLMTPDSYANLDFTTPGLSREDFAKDIAFNSILDNETLDRAWSRMSVGVKLTVLFNLTPAPACTTCNEDSGIPYRQPKGIRSRNDSKVRRW